MLRSGVLDPATPTSDIDEEERYFKQVLDVLGHEVEFDLENLPVDLSRRMRTCRRSGLVEVA